MGHTLCYRTRHIVGLVGCHRSRIEGAGLGGVCGASLSIPQTQCFFLYHYGQMMTITVDLKYMQAITLYQCIKIVEIILRVRLKCGHFEFILIAKKKTLMNEFPISHCHTQYPIRNYKLNFTGQSHEKENLFTVLISACAKPLFIHH